MAVQRSGTFGTYFGSLWGTSEPLSASEMEVNAKYIYSYLHNENWSINSISAIVANMQSEGGLNPGRWQSDDVGNISLGYGLVQWTPSTNYTSWCTAHGLSDPSEMDNNLARIIYELDHGLQWISTNAYPLSFRAFTTSSESPSELAKAFLLNYERPADQSESVQNLRGSRADEWYTFLTGQTPSEPGTKKTSKKGYNFVVFNRRKMYAKRRI